ncbi:MAG: sigma-70 family RNA polymerase sigma factor [Fimbriimonadaceae bacterium]
MNLCTSAQETLERNRSATFEALMQKSYVRVYNLAYRLAGDRADAEDLTQEAFFRAFRSFAHFECGRQFDTWMFRIVSRLFLDMLRDRGRRLTVVSYDALKQQAQNDGRHFEAADKRPNPEELVLADLYSEDVLDALSTLTSEQLRLVRLADVDNMPYQAIAVILDKPIGTVRSRLHRAHNVMRHGYRPTPPMRPAPTAATHKSRLDSVP